MTLARIPNEAILVIAGLAGLVVTIIAGAFVRDRSRRRGIEQFLAAQGFSLVSGKSGMHTENFRPFLALSALKSGAKGVRWSASGRIGDMNVCLIEHIHMVHTGKSSHAVVNTCLGLTVPGSTATGGWPLLSIGAEGWFHKLGETLGISRDLKLDSEEFNKRWRVRCKDEGFAIAVLSPEVQAEMLTADRKDWWCIGGSPSVVCLGRTAAVDAKTLEGMLGRFEAFLATMAAEVRQGLGIV